MRIDDVTLARSYVVPNAWVFKMEINGFKFEGTFENNLGSFVTMVTEMGKWFAVKHNLLRARDAGLTRPVMPGDGRTVLPGDRPT